MHRRQDLLQRQADRERDQDAGGQDDAEEDHGDRQHPARDARQRPVERLLRLLLALAHLDRQLVDDADGLGLAGVDGVAQQLGPDRELLGQFRHPLAQRHRPRLQPRQRHALQVVVGEVGHHGDGLLDRLGVPAGVLGGGRGERQIIGVGGDQHRRERLAGFSERRPDLRVAVPGGALDDRIEPGHVPGRAQHLLLIGLGDGRLHRAQFAEAVEEAVGDVFELLHRSRQHRVVRGARGQRAEHRFAQQQDLGEQFGARLVDVAMDQVLQPAGFAFQQRQDLVGFPHLPDVVPGRAEHLGAVPDQRGEHHDDGGVQSPRSTGCASGSAPRAATARCENGRARRSSPAVPLLRCCCGSPVKFTPPLRRRRSDTRRHRSRAMQRLVRLRSAAPALIWFEGFLFRAEAGGNGARRSDASRSGYRRREIRAQKRPLRPPSATARQQARRSAKGRRGGTQATNPLRDGVCGGKKRFNAFLAEFAEAWLLVAGLTGAMRRVILIILAILNCVVRCGDAGRIETAAAGIYEGVASRYFRRRGRAG